MSGFSVEDLEAMLDDPSLSEEDRNRLVAHDDEAQQELQWLQAEREMMAARSAPSEAANSALWSGIEARISQGDTEDRSDIAKPSGRPSLIERIRSSLRGHYWTVGGFAVAGATALVLMLSLAGEGEQSTTAPSQLVAQAGIDAALEPIAVPSNKMKLANQAMQEAELAYGAALNSLEEAYLEQKPTLSPSTAARIDREFAETRTLLRRAHDSEFDGLHSQRRLLSAYSTRIRSLQSTLISLEEAP